MTGTSTSAQKPKKIKEFWNFMQCPQCGHVYAVSDGFHRSLEKYHCTAYECDGIMLSMRQRDELQSIFRINGYQAVVDLLIEEFQNDPTCVPRNAGFVRIDPCPCGEGPRWSRRYGNHRCRTKPKAD